MFDPTRSLCLTIALMTGDAGAAPNKALRRKWFFGLAALVAAIILAVLQPWSRREARLPPLPNPNGYDDLLKAASLLSGAVDNLGNPQPGRDDLRAFIQANAPALALVRLGLSRACSVRRDSAITNSDHFIEWYGLRGLALLLADEGHLAEMENRNADAARSYLDAIRLGNESSRGGLIIHRLAGIEWEGYGCVALVHLAPKLSCQEARFVVSELEKADGSTVAWEEVLSNQLRFYHHSAARRQWFGPVTWITLRWEDWEFGQRSLRRHRIAAAHLRLLATGLALRCYQASNGRPPSRLDDLVPYYLAKVPQDPFSRRPLVYRIRGAKWLLYSVGPDGVDDGGQPFVTSNSKGDILFDSPW